MATSCRAAISVISGAYFLLAVAGPWAWANPVPLKDEPVPGWPKLQIELRYVAPIALRGYCLPVPMGTPVPDASIESCVRPDFWRGVCDVYIDVAHILNAELRAREVRRCRGHDQQDSNFLAEALRAWRESGENRYAEMLDFESVMFVWEPLTK